VNTDSIDDSSFTRHSVVSLLMCIYIQKYSIEPGRDVQRFRSLGFPDDENTGKVPMFSLVAGVLAPLVACELGQRKVRSEKPVSDYFDPLHRCLNRTSGALT
jgi:hypothetical protein